MCDCEDRPCCGCDSFTNEPIDPFDDIQAEDFYGEEPPDGYMTDAEADADALASAGYGMDEDYSGWDIDDYSHEYDGDI